MGWGGRRVGAGRKRKNPQGRRAAGIRSVAPSESSSIPAEPMADPKEVERVAQARLADMLPQIEELMQRHARRQMRTPETNPFKAPWFPKGAIPSREAHMAMDGAMAEASTAWLAEGTIGGLSGEGMLFLGYTYLSELAQRPEYRVISETIADDATREWIDFDVTGGPDEAKDRARRMRLDPAGERERQADPDQRRKRVERAGKMDKIKALRDDQLRLGVKDHFYNQARNDGFFGRSHLFLQIDTNGNGLDDPKELVTPIGDGRDETSRSKVPVGSFKAMQTIEPVWTYPLAYNAINPLKQDWYNPQTWYVMGQEIHGSRIPTFVGHPVPDMLKPAYAFGGLSLTQMAKPYVDIWLETRESVAAIVKSFSVMVLATDLSTMMQPGNVNALLARVAMFNMLRDNQGTFVVNKNTEDFKNVSASLAGLHELQAQAQEHMASVSRVPLVKLTGISPSGLNATSEQEIEVYDDTIMAYQSRFFAPNLSRVINFQQLSLFGEIDPEITWHFEPLRQITQAEKGQKQKDEAERDQKYVDMGAISPGEVRARIIDDPDMPYADLDPDDVPEPPAEEMDDPFALGEEPTDPNPDPSGEAADEDVDPFFGAVDGWNEADHPRAPDGKFGSGGGGRNKSVKKSSDLQKSSNVGAPLPIKGLKRVGQQMGSNPGGVFENPDGQRFYVKKPQSQAHVRNEMLAAALYGLAGSPTLKYRPVEGGEHVATEMTKLDKDRAAKLSPGEKDAARREFAVHAWLGNYDAVGTGGDNLGTVGGIPTALDLGGALAFRARGAPKGDAFGTKVTEIDTMRDPSIAPDAARLFGSMTDEQLRESAAKIAAIKDEDVRRAVDQAGEPAAMADKLIARKRDLAERFGAQAQDEEGDLVEIAQDVWAFDEAPFEESKHPRAPDGKFTSGGAGSASSGGETPSFKTKKELIGHLLTKGTTPKEIMQQMGWPSVSMPQQAAALGMKLEKYVENGVTKYKGIPMTDAEKAAMKEAAAAKKAAKGVAQPEPPKPEPKPVAPTLPAPTAQELQQAKKSAPLQLKFLPGEKPTTAEYTKDADKIVKAFNDQWAGKTITDPAELAKKVNDFKLTQAAISVLAQADKAAQTEKIAKAKAEAEAKAKEAAAKAAEEAKRAAEKNKKIMRELGVSEQQAEGVATLAKMLGSSTGDIVEKFKGYAKQAEGLGYPITGFQCALIKNYSNGGYVEINQALRSGSWTPAQHAYVSMVNKALDGMPKFSGTCRRGANLSPEQIARYKPGHIVQEQSFTSTASAGKGFGGNVRFTVKAIGKRGASIQKLSNHPHESEVLFQARTFFKVEKVETSGGVTHVHLEEWEEH